MSKFVFIREIRGCFFFFFKGEWPENNDFTVFKINLSGIFAVNPAL